MKTDTDPPAESDGFPYRHARGLAWFGPGNKCHGTDASAAKHLRPGAPTVIYVHGFERTTTGRSTRENFSWKAMDAAGLEGVTADAWLEAGWNVGVFYWNQLADDDKVADVEAKIWTAAGPQGMRWRRRLRLEAAAGAPPDELPSHGLLGSLWHAVADCFDPLGRWNRLTRFEAADTPPGASAADLFAGAYAEAFAAAAAAAAPAGPPNAGWPSPAAGEARHVRLVGHSLGAQMALRAAALLRERRAAGELPPGVPLVARVALVDPFFTPGAKPWLAGRTPAEAAAEAAAGLAAAGTAVEQLHTSGVPDLPLAADRNLPLRALTAFLSAPPPHIPAWNLRSRHLAGPHVYFRSFWDPAFAAGLARWPDARVRGLMGRGPVDVAAEGKDCCDLRRLAGAHDHKTAPSPLVAPCPAPSVSPPATDPSSKCPA